MSMIKPASAFTRDVTKLFHLDMDDITDNAGATWTDRVNGSICNFSGNIRKDADGVYGGSDINVGSLATGPALPSLSGHIVVIAITKSAIATAGTGTPFVIGSGGVQTDLAFSTNGAAWDSDGVSLASAAVTNPVALTETAAVQARAAYYDLTDSTSPKCMVAAANQSEIVVNLAHTTTGGGAYSTGIPLSVSVNALDYSANDGRRGKRYYVLQLETPLYEQELMAAVEEMARTETLYANWNVV